MNAHFVITGASVLRPGGRLEKVSVEVKDGLIQSVSQRKPSSGIPVIQAPAGSVLSPGLIEQHFHGGYGVDFNTSAVEEMKSLLPQLAKRGMTRLYPTVMTGPKAELLQALKNIEALKIYTQAHPELPQIEGIHLEGPFLNPEKRGAHHKDTIAEANKQAAALWQELSGASANIRLATVAPEVKSQSEALQAMQKAGVKLSAGHSAVDEKGFQQAVTTQGITGLTHTFNAMNGIQHRNAGPIPSAFQDARVFPELIADGHHVAPSVATMMLQVKPPNAPSNMILVGDTMNLAGLPNGSKGMMGGQPAESKDGKAINSEGNLAGSLVFLNDCVKKLTEWGVAFTTALTMATLNPAKRMGLSHVGQIKAGQQADLVLWNPKTAEPTHVWINGHLNTSV